MYYCIKNEYTRNENTGLIYYLLLVMSALFFNNIEINIKVSILLAISLDTLYIFIQISYLLELYEIGNRDFNLNIFSKYRYSKLFYKLN